MRKKVLIINPYWQTLGGGERYTAAFARFLKSKNWRVDFLWPNPDLLPQINARFGIDLTGCGFVGKDVYTAPYDLVFWVSDGSLPFSFAKKTIVHFQFPFTGVGGLSPVNFLKSRLYSFVVNSQFTKSFIDREFRINSRVIYPPVDTDGFPPGKKTNTILYVGRFSDLTQSKGQSVLIDSFKKISAKIPHWKLVLAGGTLVGTDSKNIAKLKKSAVGFPIKIITDPDLPALKRLFAGAKIFWSASGYGIDESVNPTRVEHFGITVVEAMASGCVPIIVNCGGHKESVTDGINGLLWTTTKELENRTLELIRSPHGLKVLAQSAMAKSKMFGTDNFNRALEELLHL